MDGKIQSELLNLILVCETEIVVKQFVGVMLGCVLMLFVFLTLHLLKTHSVSCLSEMLLMLFQNSKPGHKLDMYPSLQEDKLFMKNHSHMTSCSDEKCTFVKINVK